MRRFRPSAAAVLAALLGVVVITAGAGGFWLWQQNQHLESDNSELHSEIDSGGSGGSSGGSALGVSTNSGFQGQSGGVRAGGSTTSTTDGGSSADNSGLRTLLVKDFGIQLKVPPSLQDLSYAESPPASGFMQLTTVSLQKAHPCAAAGILGTVFRYPKDQNLPDSPAAKAAVKVALAGGYEYYYTPLEKDPCTDKPAVDTIKSLTTDLQQALPSITQQ
jgi:hypothetical protein